jgi:hypothetical protein
MFNVDRPAQDLGLFRLSSPIPANSLGYTQNLLHIFDAFLLILLLRYVIPALAKGTSS